MVLGALQRQAGAGNTTGRDAATGGVSLGAVPPPEHLGPVGAYLAGESFSEWCRGQVMFSNGAEIAWVVPPRLLEMARTADVKSLPHLLDALGPAVFGPAEATQASNGGGNPRVGTAFDEARAGCARDGGRPLRRRHRRPFVGPRALGRTRRARCGVRRCRCVALRRTGSGAAGDRIRRRRGTTCAAWPDDAGPIDAVVVALTGGFDRVAGNGPGWQRVLDEHAGITDRIRTDAAWVRAVSDLAAATDTPLRVVTLVDATTAGGKSRAQAATQLARAAHGATADRVDAFVIGVEAAPETTRPAAAEVAAHLVCSPDAATLSGAELVADAEWIGLRSHPSPAGTLSFGGPTIPDWLDGALRQLVTGTVPGHAS